MSQKAEGTWASTTWEAASSCRALELTLRERLQALEEMCELARHFEWMREIGKFRSPRRRG